MTNARRWAVVVLICLVAPLGSALGAEGMWMPMQIPELAEDLKGLGFEGDPMAFADLTGQPMGAVVSLGGCTASFVSPEGLIATNYHCVSRSLQYNSTPESNLTKDGFLARSRKEELSNGPGSRVWVADSIVDVTDRVLEGLDGDVPDREYRDRIDQRNKELTAECETDGYRCRVSSFFEGMKYFQMRYLEIKDVRLVYAPAAGIGEYGGETDNFRWPRHTGDFSFYRAYVGPDGKAADYNEENVPYRPEHWLKVSAEGGNPGELVMVVGYPGRTSRHGTYDQVRDSVEYSIPRRIRSSEEQAAILYALGEESEELSIKVGRRIGGLENGLTYNRGILNGMKKGGTLAARRVQEQNMIRWIEADPVRREEYGEVLPRIGRILEAARETRERDGALNGLFRGSSLLNSADTSYRLSQERGKPDMERERGYQERDWERMKQGEMRSQRSLDVRVDRALFQRAILEAAGLEPGQRIVALDHVVGFKAGMDRDKAAGLVEKFLDGYYKKTKLADLDRRLALMEMATAEIEAIGDPAVSLAVALFPLMDEIEENRKTRAGALAKLRPLYMEALLEMGGGKVYPDANGSLRVSYGLVHGTPAADGVYYTPQTTLAGLMVKHTGEGEFNVPPAQLEAVKTLRAGGQTRYTDEDLGDVPVNFLAELDTTGGNSGSAVLNARGELCGLLFDGTFESMAADYLFDPRTTRSIVVDSRYMLWVMTEVDEAGHLVEEMEIAPAAAK
ncbi:MAG: S46 family peptidase [Acidobacteria bacterium]|uniref:Dipeptidyl-peptidase n=1 Tax=Candidatus Polarisedimenticola svalbardensis TaxID=2886004 RepID=A0A8J6XZ71_9BACT|nr:S46 family peptidase [Candidatus Polarisedimenticola svalbardensis]